MRPFDPEDFARSLMGLNGEEPAEPVVLAMDREPELFEPTNDAESESASPEMEEPPSAEEVGFEDLGETDEYAATGEHDEHVDDEETEATAEAVTTITQRRKRLETTLPNGSADFSACAGSALPWPGFCSQSQWFWRSPPRPC